MRDVCELTYSSAVYDGFDFASAVAWLKSITNLPIAIKGIQTWEDALLCMQHGVHPWLSNHGGRQLDGAPSSAETLLEMREQCPEVLEKCDVIVDGGITRGGDIIKALALGARGVAVGRGFLFALAFGEEGVGKAIRILKHEMEMTMGLLGVSSIDQLRPSHVSLPLACRGICEINAVGANKLQVDARGLTFAGAATRARL
jgi:L-lactate dehydrogenase (cytochrome)